MAKNKTFYVSIGAKTGSHAKSIDDCIKWLQDYKVELNSKTRQFVNRLADYGIDVAASAVASSQYDQYISFTKGDESSGDTISIVVYGRNRERIVSQWWHKGKLVENEISPILMAEFGAGWLADISMYDVPVPGGAGTNSLYGHGTEKNWRWTSRDGTTYVARDRTEEMTPTHPMYYAFIYIRDAVNKVAKEVFG